MGLFELLFGKRTSAPLSGNGGASAIDAVGVRPELLIFGLGNPGGRYVGTRHNAGFDVIEELCVMPGVEVLSRGRSGEADCGMTRIGGKPALLVKPLTYMNLSGGPVGELAGRYGLTSADCVVIVDDFNIPLGSIRIRKDGSPGGHNGLKSVSAAVGDGYPRVRVGIGPLPKGVSVIDFVLGRFDEREREEVAKVIRTAAEAVVLMVGSGIDVAMNRYN